MISQYKNYINSIFKIRSSKDFEAKALEAFNLQYKYCKVYQEYVDLIDIRVEEVKSVAQIPFLPIKFFKNKLVETELVLPKEKFKEKVFSSSATTGLISSTHIVKDINLYEESFSKAFRKFYGEPSQYRILGLLPSYLERDGSSLVYMVNKLMEDSDNLDNGYYLYNYKELALKLKQLKDKGEKTILFGVTFALLDMLNEDMPKFEDLIIIETGGMKGRGKELKRSNIHEILMDSFGTKSIHSEYGMAELLSQAYSSGEGIFYTPDWMKVYIRDIRDPFKYLRPKEIGGLNIIDLANINSCCFIETEDMGWMGLDGGFTIEGRIKNSDLRGCNMLL